MRKRIFALLLTVLMVFLMCSVPVLAAGDEQEAGMISETTIQEEETTEGQDILETSQEEETAEGQETPEALQDEEKVAEEQDKLEASEEEQTLKTQATAGPVSYQSPVYNVSGDPKSGLADMETKTCTEYTVLTGSMTELTSGWYVLSSDITVNHSLKISGDVKLILCDEKKLVIKKEYSIIVNSGNALTIYGQEKGTGKIKVSIYGGDDAAIGGEDGKNCGRIEINGGIHDYHADFGAAIGGGDGGSATEGIVINGGNIEADSLVAAGIGGGDGDGSNITINGGTVVASGGSSGAGIGGGTNGDGNYISILGGNVTADTSNDAAAIGGGVGGECYCLTIKNCTVKAYGVHNGAAIGTGYKDNGAARDITIENADVTAIAGKNVFGHAAGIGGGKKSNAFDITIKNSKVIAKGVNGGAGIGSGDQYQAWGITITGSTVEATGSGGGAGIGGGKNSRGKDITIKDSTVTATGKGGGAGIGGGEHGQGLNITIDNSTVTAKSSYDGAGIGGGEDARGQYITIKNGSNVRAYGGDEDGGAGIGGGENAMGDVITIVNSTVAAWGGDDSAGIGGGEDGLGGFNITIDNSTVTAFGDENGAGIGGGEDGEGTNIIIKGADTIVKAYGGYDGAGIGSGDTDIAENIQILGGRVEAYGGAGGGAGIGGGYENKAKTIHFETCNVIAVGGGSRGDGVGSAKKGSKSSDITISTAEPKLALYLNGEAKSYDSGDLADPFYCVKKVEIRRPDSVPQETGHDWQFTAEGATITATCLNGEYHESCSPEFVKLLAPEDSFYDGEKKEVRVNGFIDEVELPAVQYFKDEMLLTEAPSEIGSYTAVLTLGDATAALDFEVKDPGEVQTIDLTKASSATFTSEAPFDEFEEVEVDGETVNPDYYEVTEGSTVVTLNKAFLETLDNGLHSISIISENDRADFLFIIVRGDPVPQTGDSLYRGSVTLWIVILILAAGTICALAIRNRKKKC